MARRRDYHKEYLARLRRGRGLPTAVRRGHGPLSAARAKALERGSAKDASREQKAEARRIRRAAPKAVRAYEQKYGPAGGGHAGRERTIPRPFRTEQQARDFVETDWGVSGDSYRVTQTSRGWKVTVLR